MTRVSICVYCDRRIVSDGLGWIDPDATGDDEIWAEVCDANDIVGYDHEPTR